MHIYTGKDKDLQVFEIHADSTFRELITDTDNPITDFMMYFPPCEPQMVKYDDEHIFVIY